MQVRFKMENLKKAVAIQINLKDIKDNIIMA